jgi:hypothetical protein
MSSRKSDETRHAPQHHPRRPRRAITVPGADIERRGDVLLDIMSLSARYC